MENEKILNTLILKKFDPEYTEIIDQYNRQHDNVIIAHMHQANKFYNFHNHEFFEMVYVKRGKCINMVANDNVNMSEGDFLLIHPSTFHSLYSDESCTPLNILISVNWFYALADKMSSIPTVSTMQEFMRDVCSPDSYKYIYFTNTTSEQRAVADRLVGDLLIEPLHGMIREARLTELFCLLAYDSCNAVLSNERGISDGGFVKIYNYMAQNYLTVTLDDLAEQFSYTKSYVCRLFKNNSGKSFCKSLNEIKIRKAMILLTGTNLTVEKIAEQSGFNSIEYFHRLFRKQCGLSPLGYREVYRSFND